MRRFALLVLCLLMAHCELLTRPSEVQFVPADGFDIQTASDTPEGDDVVEDVDDSATCVSMCGTACVDLQSDALHCGACNNACPAGSMCVSGQCSEVCTTPMADCDPRTAGCETDLSTSTAHCGSCNHACNATHASVRCMTSACVPTCEAGFLDCDTTGNNGCESSILGQESCGTCGTACEVPTASCTMIPGEMPRCCSPAGGALCAGANCPANYTCRMIGTTSPFCCHN